MSDTKLVFAATLDRFSEIGEEITGVHLDHLPPFTTLLVRTMNSLYRVTITHWPEVYLQGGAFFPNPTSVYLDGASIGGSGLKVGWIAVDLLVEIRAGGRRIVTSPVRAITTEHPSDWPDALQAVSSSGNIRDARRLVERSGRRMPSAEISNASIQEKTK